MYEEICLSQVSGISGYIYGVIPTIPDFIQGQTLSKIKSANIHISQHGRSDHISQSQDSKVLVGRGRKSGGQWLTCAAKSEL